MSQHQIGTADAPVAATFHAPERQVDGAPLLVALHGGTYTSTYFAVAGGPFGSFLDLASRNGFPVLTIDRPGYGGSAPVAEAENTFAHQAALLDDAIARYLEQSPAAAVVLVGHSIGGMIALEIAARQPSWPLVGVATSGMGARIPAGGAAEQLGSLPFSGVVDLPVPDREGVMFGPAGSFSERAREAARSSYAPTPFVELVNAPRWARERLAAVAADVRVPVHNVLAEHDALWDSSAEARAEFASLFSGEVSTHLAPGVGHSLDHHTAGAALHLQQLAFAFTCAVAAEADVLVP
ncbi:alpha/beta hydrolase [Angustibacter speluncae]